MLDKQKSERRYRRSPMVAANAKMIVVSGRHLNFAPMSEKVNDVMDRDMAGTTGRNW